MAQRPAQRGAIFSRSCPNSSSQRAAIAFCGHRVTDPRKNDGETTGGNDVYARFSIAPDPIGYSINRLQSFAVGEAANGFGHRSGYVGSAGLSPVLASLACFAALRFL